MPSIIKPSRIATAFHVQAVEGGGLATISAYLLFDFANPRKLLVEQALWPMVAEQLPKGAIFDKSQLKPRGELIVAGAALAPGDQPVSGMRVTARLGALEKRLAVFGDRFWRMTDRGILMTDAQPFDRMPIDDMHAYGGPDHKINPHGKGHKARQIVEAGYDAPLPNVEDADRLIRSIDDKPMPTNFGPLPPDSVQRMRYAGTYDQQWLKHVSPARPVDFNPLFHCDAPENQRLASHFIGNETFTVAGMSRGESLAAGSLPNMRLRAFVHRPADGSLTEIQMVCDTVTLFPNVTKATVAFRGIARGADAFCEDIGTVMLAVEHAEATPRPADYYRNIFDLRTDPKEAHRHALSDFQLMPQLDSHAISARRAAKLETARLKQERFIENMNWGIRKTMLDQGMPADMVQPLQTGGIDDLPLVPQPTAEEMADGDFDLAEILDDMKALQDAILVKRDRETALAELQRRSMVEAMPEGLVPDFARKPLADEAHMARFSNLSLDDEIAAAFDDLEKTFDNNASAIRGIDPDFTGAAFAHLPGELENRLGNLGAAPVVDEEAIEKQFDLACARALRLPEGSLLHEARGALDDLDFDRIALSIPVGEDATDSQREFANLFGDIKQTPVKVSAAAPTMAFFPTTEIAADTSAAEEGRRQTSATLAKRFPHLIHGEGDVLEGLLSTMTEIAPAPEIASDMTVGTLVDEQRRTLAERLDEADARMDESATSARQIMPSAIFPMEAFLPGVSGRFGAFVVAKLREGHDFRGGDLAGADLRGVDFSGLDLRSTFFERADLTNARFAGANLEGAAFTEAQLDGADFTGARMSKANLNKASLRGARLDRCVLDNCSIIGADFTRATAHGIHMSRATLIECILEGADFTGADLSELQLMKSRADGLILDKARIKRSSIMAMTMKHASFAAAELERVAFMEIAAPGADFSHATMKSVGFLGNGDLTGGNFQRLSAKDSSWNTTKLQESCFLRAHCEACLFNDCDMSASDLRLASMKNCRFDKSVLSDSDLFGINFYAASLGNIDLRRASLRGANLYFANLAGAKLGSCDLTGANLGHTLLEQPSDA